MRTQVRLADGLERLLGAYAEAGGADVSPTDVSFYEVCLAIGWYARSLEPGARGHPPEQELIRLRGILGRAIQRS